MSYLSEVIFKTGAPKEPTLEISLTTSLGYTGFRGKVFAEEGTCMFFDLGYEEYHMFWMSQVPFSLDVIFIGADLKVVDIVKGEPNDEKPFTSKEKACFVIETTYGWCADNGITTGIQVLFKSIWDN